MPAALPAAPQAMPRTPAAMRHQEGASLQLPAPPPLHTARNMLSSSMLGEWPARQQTVGSTPMQTRHLLWQSRPPNAAWLMAAWRWTARSTHRRRSHTATAGADTPPLPTLWAPLYSTPADLRCQHASVIILANMPQLSQFSVESMDIRAVAFRESSTKAGASPTLRTRAGVRGEHEGCARKAQLVRQLPPTAVHSGPLQPLHARDARTAQQQAEQLRGWRRCLRKRERCYVQRGGAQHALHACQVAQECALLALQNIMLCSAFQSGAVDHLWNYLQHLVHLFVCST